MFSFFTQPTFPKAAIGIEKDRITAVALERESSRRFAVRQAASVELPSGLIDPTFTGKNIANLGEFRLLLEEAVMTAGLMAQRSWSVSLPSNTARTAILNVENVTGAKSDSEEILDWKAEQTFGAPAGELRISRRKIANGADGKSRFFATAVKLSVLDEYETVFDDLGWKAGLILPRAVSETKWLLNEDSDADSLLVSIQEDGFTALLLHGGEPNVVRTVTCSQSELDDEIYRLLMFWHDRFASTAGAALEKFLLVGNGPAPSRIAQISSEALGRPLSVLAPEDIGLALPVGSGLGFEDLAAPAGLASLGWR
ncbi:MAG: hypothetical protein QUS14_05970 [Pyrinomonadaceae bacterium]|nr:hypothetical protein [Pyrinomonadaceae bacterium]